MDDFSAATDYADNHGIVDEDDEWATDFDDDDDDLDGFDLGNYAGALR